VEICHFPPGPGNGRTYTSKRPDSSESYASPVLVVEVGAVGSPLKGQMAVNESGRDQVYVQPFSGPGGRVVVTRNGGRYPRWAASGELFYWEGDVLFGVPVRTRPTLEVGEPRRLLTFPLSEGVSDASDAYDVSAQGRRFVMMRVPEALRPREVRVVFNWFGEMEKKLREGAR